MENRPRSQRLPRVAGAVSVIVLGLLLTYDLAHMRADRILPFVPMLVQICGPAVLLLGLVLTGAAFLGQGRLPIRRLLRWTGLLLLLVGGFPWIYTPLIIQDRGMEGSGMLGTMLFIVLGLPGLALTCASFIWRE